MSSSPFPLPPKFSPSDTLYVADKDLRIVFANAGWQRFAGENRGEVLLGAGWNPHVLDNMSGHEKVRWESIYRMLLDRRLPFHEEDILCSSPVERRIYRLRITPQEDQGGEISGLLHHLVRVDSEADAALSRRMKQIDEDPGVAEEEYHRRVITRDVRIEGFRTARYFQPLDSIGGDLLWDRRHDDGVTDLVIADVVGHGEEAGQLATKIVLMLDEMVSRDREVPDTLARVNRTILDETPGGEVLFATGLFLRLEASQRRILAYSFGHDAPIFSRSGLIELENGPPVGMVEHPDPWAKNTVQLDEHGDRFLIFSDGITEQFNIDGEMFGTEGLQREFERLSGMPLERMLEEVVLFLECFRGDALTKDDRTLLALECV